jgi:hypothetical protein
MGPHRDAVGDVSTPLTTAETVHSVGTVIVSAALFVIVLVWLVIVAMNLGKVPIYNSDGTVKLDQYARAKDIFALVLPFLTTVASGLVRRERFKPKDKPPTPPRWRGRRRSKGPRSCP